MHIFLINSLCQKEGISLVREGILLDTMWSLDLQLGAFAPPEDVVTCRSRQHHTSRILSTKFVLQCTDKHILRSVSYKLGT